MTTNPLAAYIANNFDLLTQVESEGSSFDATVSRRK
jgi:hypothetical protein